jgi:tRNA A22 N-methylase
VRKLGERLQAVADFAAGCEIVIDIGTDHGYLPIYLVTEKLVSRAIATDIMPGPLMHARKNVARYGLSNEINLVQCPGLTDELLDMAADFSGFPLKFRGEKTSELQSGSGKAIVSGSDSENLVQFGLGVEVIGHQGIENSGNGSENLQSVIQGEKTLELQSGGQGEKNSKLQFEVQKATGSGSDSENLVQFGLGVEVLGHVDVENSGNGSENLQSITRGDNACKLQSGVQKATGSGSDSENLVQFGLGVEDKNYPKNRICVTISGLGGETILSIIRPVCGVLYVLQPQSKHDFFVSELSAQGYKILCKKEVFEKNHKYFVYKVIYDGI